MEYDYDSFDNHFRILFRDLGLSYHSLHDTRHTFISMASNVGIDEVIIKRIVGHSSKNNITQEGYTHKTIQQYIDAVNKLPFGDALKGEQQLSNANEM